MAEATELHLRVDRAEPETKLRALVLARPEDEPCRFGWAPMNAIVAGTVPPVMVADEPELRPGMELVAFFTAELGDRVSKGARVDLVTLRDGNEDCLSIPITSSAPEHRWRRENTGSVDLTLGGSYFLGAPGGAIGDGSMTLALGHGVGDVRLYGGAGIGIAVCSEYTCPVEVRDAGTENERTLRGLGLAVPVFVGVESLPWQVGFFAFGAVMEYGVEYLRLDTYESVRYEWLQGPMVAPRLVLTYRDQIAPGVRGGPSNGFFGLDVPLGFVHALGQDGGFAPRIGLRLVGSVPVW